tara:strand:- start:98 stop:1459 length:1362 start_codon:yes stop_codon:yes gene_type:complete
MATKKFSDLTTTSTPNSASVFAIAHSNLSFGVTLSDIAANLPAVTATSLTSSGALTVSGNATISGDLTISGDDLFMATNTSGAALIADGTNFNPVVISGDIAIATNGAATIQADAVEASMLNDNVISGQTELSSGVADADELLISDAGTLKKVGLDTAKTYFSSTPTAITVADESSDTTCFPLFVTAATGDLGPKTGSNLAFNSSSGLLTATGFSGPLTGNVTGNVSGSSGSCTGNSATATTSTNVTVADESSDTTCFPLFVTAATGDLAPKSASGLTFNSNTDVLSGTFAGNITGNVTGNTSGSSGSCTGNAATATALATARNIGGVSFDGTGNIDLPGVNATGNQNTSGTAAGLSATLAVGSGGTGATSLTANGVLIGNGTSAVTAVNMSTKGHLLVGDGSGNPQTLSVGSDDQVLTADSSTATGLAFKAAGTGGVSKATSLGLTLTFGMY